MTIEKMLTKAAKTVSILYGPTTQRQKAQSSTRIGSVIASEVKTGNNDVNKTNPSTESLTLSGSESLNQGEAIDVDRQGNNYRSHTEPAMQGMRTISSNTMTVPDNMIRTFTAINVNASLSFVFRSNCNVPTVLRSESCHFNAQMRRGVQIRSFGA